MVEKIEDIVARQVEAFPTYKSTRSQFGIPLEETERLNRQLRIQSNPLLPPVHDVAKMAGVDLRDYLGSMKEE